MNTSNRVYKTLIIIIFIVALLLPACAAPTAIPQKPATSKEVQPTATKAAPKTFIPPTQQPTLTSTTDPNKTATPTLAPSPTPMPIPTSTPRPTKPFTYLTLQPMQVTAKAFGRIELTIDTDGQAGNPFNPDEIDLRVAFTSDTGKTITIPAFYYQDYDRQTLSPIGAPIWRVRFTPPEPGTWTAQANLIQKNLASKPLAIQVTPDPTARGFVRINQHNPMYFQYDNGDFYFPIGLNMGWAGQDVLGDYERWLDGLSQNGGNYIRVWMASWSFALEWNDTGLGDYTDRLQRAWLLDQVFNMAEERGITIMLCLINHGMFSATTNPQWHDNPYNAVLGGLLAAPEQFVSNATARDLFKRRLHYTAARWSYSTSLFAWEWWNEIHWTPITTESLRPWLAEMTAYLRALDPYNHIITHSSSESDAIWNAPELQVTQLHLYTGTFLPGALSSSFQYLQGVSPNKPILVGELGFNAEGENKFFGNHPIHFHTGLWTAPFLGYAGTGMYWWWDNYIDPYSHWKEFKPIYRYFTGENLADYHPTRAESSASGVVALVLQAEQRALVYTINKAYNGMDAMRMHEADVRYKNEGKEIPDWQFKPKPVENLTLTITGLDDGSYIAYFFDTRQGQWIDEIPLTVAQGALTIPVASLTTDLAIKILPETDPKPVLP